MGFTLTTKQPITGVSFLPLGGREGSTAKYAKQSGEWVGVSGWMSGEDKRTEISPYPSCSFARKQGPRENFAP
jgi:hypothetical protein